LRNRDNRRNSFDYEAQGNYDSRVSKIETSMENMQSSFITFVNDQKSQSHEIFNILDTVRSKLDQSRNIDWQQISVLLAAFTLMSSVLLSAFIFPMGQRIENANNKYSQLVDYVLEDHDEIIKLKTIQDLLMEGKLQCTKPRQKTMLP